MRSTRAFATLPLGALAFLGGAYLISIGTSPFSTGYGAFPPESMVLATFGGVLVYLSIPVALFGFARIPRWLGGQPVKGLATNGEVLLFSNKRIAGFSLLLTGTVWVIFSLIGFSEYSVPEMACSFRYGCPSAFSLTYLYNWIMLAIGIIILAASIALILSSRSGRLSEKVSVLATQL